MTAANTALCSATNKHPPSSEHDQELDSLLVGPIPVGVNKFIFEADPPNTANIPATEILGVTVILLTCSYDGREFVRVGYYVNNEYTDEALINEPPAKPIVEKVRRNILAEKPRVTRFAIKWDSDESAPAEFPPEQPDVDAAEDDGATYGAEEEELEGEEDEGFPEGGEAAALGASVVAPKVPGDDHDMEGAEAGGKDDDEESNAGSEDLEAESEDDEEEQPPPVGEGGQHRRPADGDPEERSSAEPFAHVRVPCPVAPVPAEPRSGGRRRTHWLHGPTSAASART